MAPGGSFRKTLLENGIRVVTEQVPYVRSISLGVWVQVGSRDEQPAEQGISHFLEHMLFKGTESRDTFDIAYSLESLGGSLDAFTCRDHTCFCARCLDEHTTVALDVLADMLQNSSLDPAEIEKEKGVVLEEIQNVEDTPDDWIHDLFAQSIWNHHPVGEPIMGTPETVSSFSRQGLRVYLDRHYRPDRMVVAAAGNLDHDRLADEVARLFSRPAPREAAPDRDRPPEPGRMERHYRREIGQTHICLGTTAYAYTHPRQYDLLVLNTALGGGMSSRLFQEVREHLGLAYSVYSYLESLEDTGLFGAYIACDESRMTQSVEILRKELARFRKEGISRDELACAKAQLRAELILGLESMGHRMGRIAREEMYARCYRAPQDLLGAIDAVSGECILDVSEDLLDERRMHLITVGP